MKRLAGSWILDTGSWMLGKLDAGSWIPGFAPPELRPGRLDAGFWDVRFWISDFGIFNAESSRLKVKS